MENNRVPMDTLQAPLGGFSLSYLLLSYLLQQDHSQALWLF